MKINAINTYNPYQQKNNIKEKTSKNNYYTHSKEISSKSYPTNYYVASFGKKNIIGQNINQQSFYYCDLINNPINTQIKVPSGKISDTTLRCVVIGALSKDENIIPDMVEFIKSNKARNETFNKIIKSENLSFDEQMKFLEKFFITYPKHLKKYKYNFNKLHDEIKANNNPNDLKLFIKNLEENINKFLEKITLLKNAPNEFPYSLEMLNKIAIFANPLPFKTNLTNKDFGKLLIKNINYNEMKILNGSNETKEYNELFPEGIKNKMRKIIKTPQYLNLANSASFAILQEALENKLIDESYISNLLKQNTSIDKELKTLLKTHKFEITKLNHNYNKYKLELTQKDKNDILKILLKEIPHITEDDKINAIILLNEQGNYLKNIFKDDNISKLTIMKFWNDFDNIHETNYSANIAENIKLSEIIDDCIDFINKLDISDFDKE